MGVVVLLAHRVHRPALVGQCVGGGLDHLDRPERLGEIVVGAEPDGFALPAESPQPEEQTSAAAKPAIHLPLADPYQAPEGYVIKANTHSGLYYTPECALYDHTVPEVWFASEELAQANGFIKAE
jgi:hypothetical protein